MLEGIAVTALGTMSGTSLDGVDAAVVETDGVRIFGFGPVAYRAYSVAEQEVLRLLKAKRRATGVIAIN